jgi:HAE1 family hydrophobic/amphiphilic exporter-1
MLSLVFVPAVFTVMDDLGRLAWSVFSRLVGEKDEPHAPAHGPSAPAIRPRPARDVQVAAE